jgi:hypothetical protein
MNAETVELLREIRDELRAIREAVERHGAQPQPDATAQLLRAIYAAVGDRVFSAGDLLIHAALPVAGSLHTAIIAAVGVCNARKLGKTLARIEGHELDGVRAVRVDSDSTGILWSVRRV